MTKSHEQLPNAQPTTSRDHHTVNPLRHVVVRRLGLAGSRHARRIAESQGQPHRCGPHAILFFFQQPTTENHQPGQQPGQQPGHLAIANRLFIDGADVAHLAQVLRTLHQRAHDYGRGLDVLRHLTSAAEPMHPACTYVGIGTSTVWPTDSPHAAQDTGMAWTGLAYLSDGTELVAETTMTGLGVLPPRMRVTTTHNLGIGSVLASPGYTWTWAWASPNQPSRAQQQAPLAELRHFHHHLITIPHTEACTLDRAGDGPAGPTPRSPAGR